MADETQRRIIYLEINASKAVDGSTAATRALASVEKGASSAGAAVEALEAATVAAGGAAQRTALNLAESAQSAANLNAAYRTTAGGALELARATTAAAGSAQAQAAGFARLAEQKTIQASLAQTRALMDGVARSTEQLAHVYGAATVATTTFANAQAQAAGYAKLAEQNMIAAATAKSRATMGAVESLTPEQIKAFYFGTGGGAPASQSPTAAGRTSLTAQQRLMLGYQFNDIFTSAAGGMSPLMIAAQQGPQITQVFGGIGNTLAAIPKPALAAGGGLLAGLGIALAVSELKGLSDALDTQKRKLGDMLGDQRLSAQAYADIAKQAAAAGESIAAATAQYVQFSRAGVFVGATGTDVAGLTAIVGRIAKLGGSSPEEQSAGSSALARALKESVVSASNLDAILESMPGLGRRIADGLGLSVTQLRMMADAGQLTNRQVFDALLSQQDKVNAKFAEAGITVGGFFAATLQAAEDLAVALYKTVANMELVNSKAEAVRKAAAANSNRPTPATPRVIGNSGSALSYEEMILSGESGLTDAGTLNGAARLQTQFLDIQRASRAAADEAILSAAKIADKLDPLTAEMRSLQQQTDTVTKGIDALQSTINSLDTTAATRQIEEQTRALQALREKADAAGGAYYQALNAAQLRQQQSELGMTPGQRAYASNVSNLAKPGSGVSIEEAQTVVDAQQLQMLDDMIQKQAHELQMQQLLTVAMRSGKRAADDAAVAMQILGISFDQLNTITPELQVKLDVLAEILGKLREEARAQGGIDASKPFLDELAGIAAAMEVVTKGAYAMRRAEAEARAARDENGTGALQMQVFDARQGLTDASMLSDLQRSIELTNALAAAAGSVVEQKRIQLDYDIKIAQLAAGPASAALIAEKMRADAAAKTNREMREGLADMQRQVDMGQEQLDIIRTGAPDMAAQLAMLQKRNDLLAKGADLSKEENAQQIVLAGQKARIDEQISIAREASDATKRTWMNAYDGIQSYGADAFFDVMTGATVTGADAAKSLKNIFFRAFSEIAAAAVIKPLIAPIFQAGQAAGIIPAGVGGAAWGQMPSAANSNGISMPSTGSMGWFGDTFSGVGNWLKSPITPTTYAPGYGAAADYASLSGTPMPSGMTSGGQLGGLTWGQGIAGLGQIGMGAYNLINSKSTGQTIGGIGSMVGGVVSMLPIPGAQIVGPLISLASQFLPSLFGEGDTRTHSSTNANLRYGSGGWYTTGGAYGAGANSSQGEAALRGTSTGIDTLFGLMGGIKDPSKVWGLDASSWTAQGKDWSYTSNATHLVDPNGNKTAWRMNTDGMENTGAAQVAILSMLDGAVGELAASTKTALEAMRSYAPTMEEVGKNLTFVTETYDRLGKAALTIKPQFDTLTSQFDEMTKTAQKLGLALAPVEEAQKKATERLGQDYIDNLIDPVAAQLRAWEDEKQSILANVDYIRQHTDVVVDMARVNEALLRKEATLKEQLYGGAISQLEDAIKRLTYGDLSNITGAGSLAGMKASFDATVAQARAGNVDAYSRIASEGTTLADASRSYYASGPEYEAIRREILAIFSELQVQMTGGPAPTPMASNGNASVAQGSMADLSQMFAASLAESSDLKQQVKTLTAVVERLVSKRA
mgnify:CR=1 FL=1